MADNPFDDPDVQQQANNGPPPAPQQVYGNSAYDDDDSNAQLSNVNIGINEVQAVANYIPEEQQKQIAISAGSAVANQAANKMQNDYNESAKTQSDQHEAPPPPTFCIKLFNWFPLRYFSFAGGILLIASPILDLAFTKTQAIQFFIYVYLVAFGVITVFVESPTWTCTRFFQLKLFFWFRLLSRMWGRAWFYLFVSILCYGGANSESGAVFTIIAGVYITVISILSFIFSRMAGKKFARMREYIAAGAEGDEMEGRMLFVTHIRITGFRYFVCAFF